MAKGEQQGQYNGQVIKRKTERTNEEEISTESSQQTQPNQNEDDQDDKITTEESVREIQIRIKKRNANRVLHERNIYVFLASVAEDAMNNTNIKSSDIVGFLLVKKLLQLVDQLATNMKARKNIFNLELWDQFVQSK